jgi:hypothetical protein
VGAVPKPRGRARAPRPAGSPRPGGPALREVAPEDLSAALFHTDPDRRTALSPQTRQTVRQLGRRSARSGRLSPLGYNLTISHDHRFLWFRVAKAGTRTVLGHLADHDVPLDVHHAMRLRYPTTVFEDYFKFAFVRHPRTRFVSAWRNKVVQNNYFGFDDATLPQMQQIEGFARWAAEQDLSDLATADHHLALQTRLVDLTQIDYLGRLETFDDDFAAICERIGVPATRAEVRNRTGRGDGADEPMSEELRSLVAEIYRRDFQVFGY